MEDIIDTGAVPSCAPGGPTVDTVLRGRLRGATADADRVLTGAPFTHPAPTWLTARVARRTS